MNSQTVYNQYATLMSQLKIKAKNLRSSHDTMFYIFQIQKWFHDQI